MVEFSSKYKGDTAVLRRSQRQYLLGSHHDGMLKAKLALNDAGRRQGTWELLSGCGTLKSLVGCDWSQTAGWAGAEQQQSGGRSEVSSSYKADVLL